MLRKIHIAAIVLLLLILFVAFGISSSLVLGNNELENSSMVCLFPDNIAGADVGETVAISVILSEEVENLYGFDIQLKWDTATLEYISHVVMAPVESYSQGVLNDPTFSLKDEVDSSAGTCWIACSSMPPAEPFSGNGVFLTITFKVLSTSNEKQVQLVSATLSDDAGHPIVHQNPEEPAVEPAEQTSTPTEAQKQRRVYGRDLWWQNGFEERCAHERSCEHPWHP
jgi:hypothetical protein